MDGSGSRPVPARPSREREDPYLSLDLYLTGSTDVQGREAISADRSCAGRQRPAPGPMADQPRGKTAASRAYDAPRTAALVKILFQQRPRGFTRPLLSRRRLVSSP